MPIAFYIGASHPMLISVFISRAVVFLPLTAKVCVIMGKQFFNGLAYGVAPYPNLVLATYINPRSPFQSLRQLSSQLLSGYEQRVQTELWKFISNMPFNPTPLSSFSPPAPPVSNQQEPITLSLPAGHYYILVDTLKEVDIVPIIVLFAINSRKVMCRIPANKDLHRYRKLMRGFDLNIIVPKSAKHPVMKIATEELKSSQRGILLRNEHKDWHVHWSKSLVDCVIFCGVPPEGIKKWDAWKKLPILT
ncbi:unnamed protein product [Rhizoctonia solani]|uniref:Uncharacterized protein n=1 Tax=Rhizoctonia solani TaxID=456999 RepID=A0A8H3CB50_9AGAM|nr:unnamed protein product [Rhizoctonia solani]